MIRKIKLISKFMTSQPGKKIAINILPNMSRSEENRTVKFDQLMEVRNTFLEKPYIKCRGDTIPRPFSKRSKLSIFLDE